MDSLERQCEAYSGTINATPTEDWERRNKALLQMTAAVEAADLSAFTPSVFRHLKDPIKSLILDLRSQQVRDVCLFLTVMARVCGNNVKQLLREVFQTIMDALKQPNKVMSGFVDDCICNMISTSTFKSAIPIVVGEIKESKAKHVREKCMHYVNLILVSWDIGDKEGEVLTEAVRLGLEDASLRARETSRVAYLNIRQSFPKKAEKLKSQVGVCVCVSSQFLVFFSYFSVEAGSAICIKNIHMKSNQLN
jgi:hypothetical protein